MVDANVFNSTTLLSELMIIFMIKNAFDTVFFKLDHTEHISILLMIFVDSMFQTCHKVWPLFENPNPNSKNLNKFRQQLWVQDKKKCVILGLST